MSGTLMRGASTEVARLAAAARAARVAAREAERAGQQRISLPGSLRDAVVAARRLERGNQQAPEDRALDLVLMLASLHPAAGALRLGLLARELWRISQASSPIATPLQVGGSPGTLPAGWVQYRACGGGGSWLANIQGPGPCSENWPMPDNWGDLGWGGEPLPIFVAMTGVANIQVNGSPGNYYGVEGDAWVWEGGGVMTPPVVPFPPVEAPAAVVAAAGLAVPMARPGYGYAQGLQADLVEAADLLMLPNARLRPWASSWVQVKAAQDIREALGLRLVIEPGRLVRGFVKPAPDPVVQDGSEAYNPFQNRVPGMSVSVDPAGKLELARPHRFAPPKVGTREKKMKVRGKLAAINALLIGAFTESNDLIESIWKALPRAYRRAGRTKTGNRRTDSMLKDIWRGWGWLDWTQALANIAANEVEDQVIGRTNKVLNAASLNSGQGLATNVNRWYGELGGVTPGLREATGFIEANLPELLNSLTGYQRPYDPRDQRSRLNQRFHPRYNRPPASPPAWWR